MATPDQPNMPEITKTTLPLLSTVLAGFSMLIIVQLFIRPDANQFSSPPNYGLVVGLIVLTISVPAFIASSIFGVWGQAYNYQYLTKDVREVVPITETGEALATYITHLKIKWQNWHKSATGAFACGTIALIGGTATLLWTFIGPLASLPFLGMIVLSLILGLWLRNKDSKLEKAFADARKEAEKKA
jgi:hypothetical protein